MANFTLSKDKLAKIRKDMPKITPKQFDKILTKGKTILSKSTDIMGSLFKHVKRVLSATTSPGMIVENEMLVEQSALKGLFAAPFNLIGGIVKMILNIVSSVIGAAVTTMAQASYSLFGGTVQVFFGTVFSLLGALVKSIVFMAKDISGYIIGLIFNLTPREMNMTTKKKIERMVEKTVNTMMGTMKKLLTTFWNGGMNIVSFIILGGFSIFLLTSFILRISRKAGVHAKSSKPTQDDNSNNNFGGYFKYDPIFEQTGIFASMRKNTVKGLNFVSGEVIGLKSMKDTKLGMLISLLFLVSCGAILAGLYVMYNKSQI